MKVLLTGGAGFIGSHIAVELLQGGFEVVVVDNYSNSDVSVNDKIKEAALTLVSNPVSEPSSVIPQPSSLDDKITFYYGDCRDGLFMDQVFREHEIDAVIHLAGLKAVGESVAKPLEYYDNNIGSTLVLTQCMRDHGVKKLIFSSSATVYSGDNTVPLTEESKTGNCTNPYGWTKYMIERMLMDMAVADKEWSIVLLRYFNPVGAHPSGLIGENPNGIPNNLMPFICRVAKANLTSESEAVLTPNAQLLTPNSSNSPYGYLSVFGNDYDTPDGTGVRDYIHVVDLAQGHVAALSYLYRMTGAQPINLGTGHGYSVLDMVSAFERVNGVKVPYKIVARRPGDLATVYADPNKAAKELLWQAKFGLDDMVRDGWRYINKEQG